VTGRNTFPDSSRRETPKYAINKTESKSVFFFWGGGGFFGKKNAKTCRHEIFDFCANFLWCFFTPVAQKHLTPKNTGGKKKTAKSGKPGGECLGLSFTNFFVKGRDMDSL
jgi:hypothetical protein